MPATDTPELVTLALARELAAAIATLRQIEESLKAVAYSAVSPDLARSTMYVAAKSDTAADAISDFLICADVYLEASWEANEVIHG